MDVFATKTSEEIKQANLNVLNMLSSADGEVELSDKVTNAIRTRIREEGFLGRIMERRPTTPAESQVELNEDKIYKVVNIADESSAATCNLVGELEVRYWKGKRARIDMWAIKTPRYEKTEEEIVAMDSFIIDDLVKSLHNSIEQAEDARFIELADAIITGAGYNIPATATSLIRKDMCAGLNMLSSRELRTNTILMHEFRKNDILGWDGVEIGQTETSNLFYEGLSRDKIFRDVTWLSSLKPFMNPLYVYYFAAEEYLGRFYEWLPVKVIVEKKGDKVSFYAKEWIGFGVINTKGLGRLDITPVGP